MVALISALDGIRDFDLKDHLPVYPLEQVGPLFWLSFIASWTVCYLVHLPSDTRLFRQALWPVSVGAFVWAVITVDMRGREYYVCLMIECEEDKAGLMWQVMRLLCL